MLLLAFHSGGCWCTRAWCSCVFLCCRKGFYVVFLCLLAAYLLQIIHRNHIVLFYWYHIQTELQIRLKLYKEKMVLQNKSTTIKLDQATVNSELFWWLSRQSMTEVFVFSTFGLLNAPIKVIILVVFIFFLLKFACCYTCLTRGNQRLGKYIHRKGGFWKHFVEMKWEKYNCK